MTRPTDKCVALVDHLLKRLVDDPEFIECSGKLTRTYELLLDAASAISGSPRAQIELEVTAARKDVESYRPLESRATHYAKQRDAAHEALSKIAEGWLDADEARRVAREAL